METKFIQGDCVEILPSIKNVDLIVTDPPYNIGWQYSKEVNDNKKDYHEWCLEWAELCFASLKDDGVFCIINYPENNNILYTDLVRKGYKFVQELIWHYSTNIGHGKYVYTRNYRTILVFKKGKTYTFNPTRQPYKDENDKRIIERMKLGFTGPIHYTTFDINLCKNTAREKKQAGINQLPSKLVDMLINTYSNEGEMVLDPFVGNGTVMERATFLNRDSIGIDINNYNGENDE